METIKDLYQKALEATGKKNFSYDPQQLDCLFTPEQNIPTWNIDNIINADNKTKDGKTVSRDTVAVLRALSEKENRTAFVLIAPAFLGQFSDKVQPGMIRAAFKSIGFDGLLEVAVFADILTLREALEFDRNIHTNQDFMLTSCCCPMWLAMIKKMYTNLVPHMPPSVSPMIAAGLTVKRLHPDAITVFVGPCIAKKAEAREKDIAGAVDFVLTFQETQEIFDLLQVNLLEQPDSIKEFSSGTGRIYARTGGVSTAVKATLARLHPDREIALTAQQADGIPACREMINKLVSGSSKANFFEGMGCAGGCVGGPKSLLKKEDARNKVNAYGKAAVYKTPLDNPYVLELLTRLNFHTLEGLLNDKDFFVRKIQ